MKTDKRTTRICSTKHAVQIQTREVQKNRGRNFHLKTNRRGTNKRRIKAFDSDNI